MQNGLNWCNESKSRCHKAASNVFTMNAPNPPHWTPNSSFVAFRSVWLHLGPFRYCMKLGVKWAELVQLMQKFKPQSCVRNFSNKSTLSTPCFGAFHSVWVHMGPFRYCMKLGAKWVEVVQLIQKFVPRNRVRCFHNERTQSTPLDLKLIYCRVS